MSSAFTPEPQRRLVAHASAPSCGEKSGLEQIEPLWDELFPAERARIVRLRLDGLGSLLRDLAAQAPEAGRAAA